MGGWGSALFSPWAWEYVLSPRTLERLANVAASYGTLVSGMLFGAGWWMWADACTVSPNSVPFDQVSTSSAVAGVGRGQRREAPAPSQAPIASRCSNLSAQSGSQRHCASQQRSQAPLP